MVSPAGQAGFSHIPIRLRPHGEWSKSLPHRQSLACGSLLPVRQDSVTSRSPGLTGNGSESLPHRHKLLILNQLLRLIDSLPLSCLANESLTAKDPNSGEIRNAVEGDTRRSLPAALGEKAIVA